MKLCRHKVSLSWTKSLVYLSWPDVFISNKSTWFSYILQSSRAISKASLIIIGNPHSLRAGSVINTEHSHMPKYGIRIQHIGDNSGFKTPNPMTQWAQRTERLMLFAFVFCSPTHNRCWVNMGWMDNCLINARLAFLPPASWMMFSSLKSSSPY